MQKSPNASVRRIPIVKIENTACSVSVVGNLSRESKDSNS